MLASLQKLNGYIDFKSIENKIECLREDAVDWAHMNGLIMRTSQHKGSSDICQIVPFSLFPSPFPKNVFESAISLQEVS